MDFDKRALIQSVKEKLEAELATMTRLAKDAAEAATHEENKPENDKDMRSTEASYLARGQAERARELERSLSLLAGMLVRPFTSGEAISAGALIELVQKNNTMICFFLPAAGGTRVRAGGVEVQVVTPTSPLGRALMGLAEGDEAEVPTPQGTKTYEIVRVF